MLAQERYSTILKVLLEKNTIKVSKVMELCGVSHETARRDLEVMQENGLAKRVHGGAVLIPQQAPVNSTEFRAVNNRRRLHAENVEAASEAAKLINPGDSILIESGTTMAHLAHAVRDLSDLVVLTPSLYVINELDSTNNKIIALGGELSREEHTFTGRVTEMAFSQYNVDKAFLSCGGIQLENGVIMDYDTYGMSRQLIREHSAKMILVINSEKLHAKAFVNVFDLSLIDTIVVNSGIPQEDADVIREKGIELIIASGMGPIENEEEN